MFVHPPTIKDGKPPRPFLEMNIGLIEVILKWKYMSSKLYFVRFLVLT